MVRCNKEPRKISPAGGRFAANFSRCRSACLCFIDYIEIRGKRKVNRFRFIRIAGSLQLINLFRFAANPGQRFGGIRRGAAEGVEGSLQALLVVSEIEPSPEDPPEA
jgi:hypothetical protein